MISSQRRDGQFVFALHVPQPRLLAIDSSWRKDSIGDVNIFVPETEAGKNELNEITEMYLKIPHERPREWTESGIADLLGPFADLGEIDQKSK
jgi:hypothetical protein